MIWGSKCYQNNPPVVCDDCVKYEEAEIVRLVAILKTNNCGDIGGGEAAANCVEYSKQPALAKAA